MTPCLVVLIGVLFTVANVDARITKRSEANKARRSSRNGIQYNAPQTRRFSSSIFRREAQGDLGSDLVSSIQKQVADQISFQQDLQKQIQDSIQQKLADKYKQLQDKLTNGGSQNEWYIPNDGWLPNDNLQDNGDNSFMMFGPGTMSRSFSRNNAKTGRLSTETVSERMSGYPGYSAYSAGPQPPPPPKRPPAAQEPAGAEPVPGSAQLPIAPHIPSFPQQTSPTTGQLPGINPILGIHDITLSPCLQEMIQLAGVDLSNIDLSAMLAQLPELSQFITMEEGLTAGSTDDPLNIIEPYSLSFNNGKSAWNVNVNPGESTRRQYDELVDADEEEDDEQYDEFTDPNQLSEQTDDEWVDGNQYVPLEEDGVYDLTDAFDETDPFENIGDFNELEQYIPEDATSILNPVVDDAEELSSEQCAAIQESCMQCIHNPEAFDSKYNPIYGTDSPLRKQKDRSRRKFTASRRSNRRRFSTRRQCDEWEQTDQYNPEELYDPNGIYDPYENTGTYQPVDQLPVDSMSPTNCQTIEQKCARCIIKALNEMNPANYDQQLDPQYTPVADDQLPLDNPYGDIRKRLRRKRLRKNKKANRANRTNRMARRRRLFT